jgi:gas vesicle protein
MLPQLACTIKINMVKKVVKKLSKNCQKDVKKMSKRCQKDVKKMSKKCKKFVRNLSKNVKKLSKISTHLERDKSKQWCNSRKSAMVQ